jgi:hypothetical protein
MKISAITDYREYDSGVSAPLTLHITLEGKTIFEEARASKKGMH